MPDGRAARKELFGKIGKAISRKDLLQGYDGYYQFEIRTSASRNSATSAFGGKLGKAAPRLKTLQWKRTIR